MQMRAARKTRIARTRNPLPNHYPVPWRGIDRRPFRHLPINRVLVRALVAEASVVTLRNFEFAARRIRQLIDVRIVVLRAIAAQLEIIRVAVLPFAATYRRR